MSSSPPPSMKGLQEFLVFASAFGLSFLLVPLFVPGLDGLILAVLVPSLVLVAVADIRSSMREDDQA